MRRALLILLGLALVLVGPVMFMLSRTYELDQACAQLRPGETPAEVVRQLGAPDSQMRRGRGPAAVLEYRYRVWPLPARWVIDFRAGRLVRRTTR